jgi:hypothetical protein
MISAPPVTSVALLALSLFLGLAFEDFFARTDTRRLGGIRIFPMLALGGGVLYLFDPVHFIPFTGGLLVLGGWLVIFYRHHVGQHDETGELNVGLVVPLVNIHAYLLGAITLATAIMYLRLLAIVAVFNRPLALTLAIPLGGLALAALVICAVQYWFGKPVPETRTRPHRRCRPPAQTRCSSAPRRSLPRCLFWCRSSRSG